MNHPRRREIGPYRLDDRLGAGGMGEVWRAWDSRLERSVAVKLIRPDSCQDQQARERFRREARAAAALSHPAIVQIHDVVTSAEEEAIVMELVEGELLSRRIAAGPLAIGAAVRLGREISEGLAAAHARGLLHRDLKAENVMIATDGHAKILDFGLARRLDGETSLTRSDTVVGTFRSMSPEQARGLPLDPRSDLFSLGVLLYEMSTGRSPFLGRSAPDTLTRVCTTRQAPAREVRPELPGGWSDLIDRLLEKDPALRPASARDVVATLDRLGAGTGPLAEDGRETRGDGEAAWPVVTRTVFPGPSVASVTPAVVEPAAGTRRWLFLTLLLAGLGLALTLFLARTPALGPPTLYVAVPEPQVVAGRGVEGVDLISAGVRMALLRVLLSLQGVAPLAPEQVDPVGGTPVELARATAAGELVTSRLDCTAGICQVSLSRVAGRDGRMLWTQSFEIPVGQPYVLAETAASQLRMGYADHPLRAEAAGLEIRPQDYAEYVRLRRLLDLKEKDARLDRLLQEAAALRRRSPRFLEALLLEAGILEVRFNNGRSPADLDRAFGLLATARRLAASDVRPLLTLFDLCLRGERLDQAEEALREMERLRPGSPEVQVRRALLLERRGAPRQALEQMRQAVRLRPSWMLLYRLADMEYRLGEVAAARRDLEALLDLAPRLYAGHSLLAQLELLAGSPRRAAELYSDLVARSPEVNALANLGLANLLLARYPQAEQSFRQAWARQPRNAFAVLNLADACLLAGKREEAAALYGRTLELADRDPAASHWQLQSARAQALAHLGRRRQAAEAVQRVLRAAPENPQANYEAALVYTLVGDETSALVNTAKALERGVGSRWFAFPWFAPLRASPDFQDLLAQHSRRAR